jgi:hypothetical protein
MYQSALFDQEAEAKAVKSMPECRNSSFLNLP